MILPRRKMLFPLVVVVIAACCGVGHAAEPAKTDPSDEKLDGNDVPDMRFDDVPFGEVAEFLSDVVELNLHLDRAALERQGITRRTPVTCRMRGLTTRQALTKLLQSVPTRDEPLTFGVVGDVVFISNESGLRLARDLYERDQAKGADSATGKALDQELPKTRFENMVLRDALVHLTNLIGVGIYVDYKSLGTAGVSADTPVDLVVRDVPARQALRLILIDARSEQAVADFTISPEGKLSITSTVPAR